MNCVTMKFNDLFYYLTIRAQADNTSFREDSSESSKTKNYADTAII